MTVLDLTPYIIDPFGLKAAFAHRKALRLSGKVSVGAYVRNKANG